MGVFSLDWLNFYLYFKNDLLIIIISFLITSIISLLIVRYKNLHLSFTADSYLLGVQKFHTTVVPRVGGIAIFLGILVAFLVHYFQNSEVIFFHLT
jgi:UDP-N-acetylmuramyl pentapeptide phosphotransferase/UDP-N-acetylglucosamine-1-phosphate transferase